MSLLQTIHSPADVQRLPPSALPLLAQELRQTILETVSRNGGHLASNLGTVELTIALLRVFSPPHDKVVWDVGHQTYSWKLLTGRQDRFSTLRQFNGLSGFPKPEESLCDTTVAGHAGVALSTALGMAVARDALAREDESQKKMHVIAVIGDGSMTNGISLEALNSLSDTKTKVIVILNDNEMSIAQNVGALSRCLGRMLADLRYNRIKHAAEAAGHRLHMTFLRGLYHWLEQAVKSIWLKNAFFEEFGLRYVGPIDGHDFPSLQNALQSAAEYDRPVLIHVATQKGKGFPPAERSPSHWHGVGAFDLSDSPAVPPSGTPGYSAVCGEELTRIADENPRVMAITAAMAGGTGLLPFARKFPRRFFDVGICEEHAVVFAAGLATAGFRPVFAVYSTFLQRAVDCVMHDVCLSNLPVLFCVDRAGVVGSDGPTHHGVFDIPMLRSLPNLSILQPRSHAELRAMLRWALRHNGPVVIRYPKASSPETEEESRGIMKEISAGAEIVREMPSGEGRHLWIWALGDQIPLACHVADLLRLSGFKAGVVNARFIKPLDIALLRTHGGESGWLVTMENGALAGGFGSAVREALADVRCRVQSFGWPDAFVPQGNVSQLAESCGLSVSDIAKKIIASAGEDE